VRLNLWGIKKEGLGMVQKIHRFSRTIPGMYRGIEISIPQVFGEDRKGSGNIPFSSSEGIYFTSSQNHICPK
jgi:hypothetical protein